LEKVAEGLVGEGGEKELQVELDFGDHFGEEGQHWPDDLNAVDCGAQADGDRDYLLHCEGDVDLGGFLEDDGFYC
jgi:hypothetical protein